MANKETTLANKKRRAHRWMLWQDKRRQKNAARIVNLRERLGFTQQQLAASFPVSVRTVQGWEQGHKPTGKNARRLAALEQSLSR